MGIIGKRAGSVNFEGHGISKATSYKIAKLGIALCPEERGIFASLDVRENLMLPRLLGVQMLRISRSALSAPSCGRYGERRHGYVAAQRSGHNSASGHRPYSSSILSRDICYYSYQDGCGFLRYCRVLLNRFGLN
jgi:hypothetical protein